MTSAYDRLTKFSAQSNEAHSPDRRSLRTAKTGTNGNAKLTGFVDTSAETSVGDDFSAGSAGSIADFGANDAAADVDNNASVNPAGALDSSSGSSGSQLTFGASSASIAETDGGFADPETEASGSGEVGSFFDTSSSSEISPTMVIPGSVTNATTTTKGTKSTGGDGTAAVVPGVEMVGAANGTQGVTATGIIEASTEADIDDTFFSTSIAETFFDGSGDASQDSASAAGPTQDGASNLLFDVFGFSNSTTSEEFGFAEADGALFVNGSTIGAGAAVFDNTTAAP